MKRIFLIPLLVCLFSLTSCKYGTLEKMTKAAGISVEVVNPEGNNYCVDKFLESLDQQISSKKKSKRSEIYELLKANIKNVVISPDKVVKTVTGISSTLYHVTIYCPNSGSCYAVEGASKSLNSTIVANGTNPVNAIKKSGETLFLGVQSVNDLSVAKKYYTKSVEAYDQLENLEDALNNDLVWNHPLANRDQVICGKFLTLEELVQVITSKSNEI